MVRGPLTSRIFCSKFWYLHSLQLDCPTGAPSGEETSSLENILSLPSIEKSAGEISFLFQCKIPAQKSHQNIRQKIIDMTVSEGYLYSGFLDLELKVYERGVWTPLKNCAFRRSGHVQNVYG